MRQREIKGRQRKKSREREKLRGDNGRKIRSREIEKSRKRIMRKER
jgi:hypothetical protein